MTAERCLAINLLLMDVDGVLTDGGIVYTSRGDELKAFHVRDGSGLKLWTGQGKRAGIITGRSSEVVARRAAELGLDPVIQGAADKGAALDRILTQLNKRPEQVCYVGDDVIDLPAMRRVGLAVAPADACAEAKADAHYVTSAAGGRGAVREVIELILKSQGAWDAIVARYRSE